MYKIKKISILLVLSLLFVSCSEYHKVLSKGTVAEKYKYATKMYESQEFGKALNLFESISRFYRGKPQMERIRYMIANASFNERDYVTAAYHFGIFTKSYPKSSKAETAEFMSALSYYNQSPAYSLDPTDTRKAIEVFQSFIDKYPNSSKIDEANKYYNILKAKLEKKLFEIAKNYYKTAGYNYRNYKACITAFDNLLSEYLGTKYKEEALYYRLKSAHDYAMKSYDVRKPKRIETAIKAYDKLNKYFPKSKFMSDSNNMLARLKKEEKRVTKLVKS